MVFKSRLLWLGEESPPSSSKSILSLIVSDRFLETVWVARILSQVGRAVGWTLRHVRTIIERSFEK